MGNRVPVAAGLLAVSIALLLLVGLAGPSAAKPDLGPRGWAPGELAWAPTSAVVTALLWVAYLLGAAAVALQLRSPTLRVPWWVPVGLGVLVLLTGPFGSPDHTVYAAYGRIAADGGDPYLTPPDRALAAGDPVLTLVDAPWSGTVSIYGPVATGLQAVAALVGGNSMRQVVWVWQVLVVLAWLAVRWLLRRGGADPGRVDTLWTLNPLVLGLGVLGAHVDLIGAALALAALVASRRSALLAGVLSGLAVSTKVTYGLVAVALVLAWSLGGTGRATARRLRELAGYVLPTVVVALVAHLWAGRHVLDQLDRARDSVSLAMPWRLLLEALRPGLGDHEARTVVGVGALVVFGLLVAAFAVATRDQREGDVVRTGARWTVVLGGAYALSAPYSLPWYDLLVWVALPLLAPSVLDLLLLGRLLVMAVAYVPGRVTGMSATVRDLTMLVRRRLVPVLQLGLWAGVTLAAWRASSRSSAPPPRAPGPTPR